MTNPTPDEIRKQIETLAALITDANKRTTDVVFGCCTWTDVNGEARCNNNWSQFQCQQAGGEWTEGGQCS